MHTFDDEMTAVQFTVVKYVPDTLRDEPINVGLVARHSDGRTVLRSLPTFGRVRSLAGGDSNTLEVGLRFLRSSLDRNPDIDLGALTMSDISVIRFSEQMGGLTIDEDEFIDEQFEFYCGDNIRRRAARGSDRRQLRITLRKAIASIGVDASRYEVHKKQVRGKTGGHDFDFGFVNGHVSLVRAISLQSQDSYVLSEARAISFAARDTETLHYDITAFVALPEIADEVSSEALGMIKKNVQSTVIIGQDDVTAKLRVLIDDQSHLQPLTDDKLLTFA